MPLDWDDGTLSIPGLERLLEDEVAVGMAGDHHILVAQARLDRKAPCVICVQLADGVNLDEDLMGGYKGGGLLVGFGA